MPAGDWTISEIIAGVGAIATASLGSPFNADLGVILTDTRLVSNDREALNIIIDQSPTHIAQGLMISFDQLAQLEGPNEGTGVSGIARHYRFRFDFVYPFNAKKDDGGLNSMARFRIAIEAMINCFNQNRTLALLNSGGKPDENVRHNMLQTLSPLAVVAFGNAQNALIEHVALLGLEVVTTNYTTHPEF